MEVKTTKNTERRVQRCIVLEDGRIIEHDDPHIVVDTIEDTQTHEFDHLEDKAVARELQASMKDSYRRAGITDASVAGTRRSRHHRQRKSLQHDQHGHQQGHQDRSGIKKNATDMISGNNVVRHDTEETTDGSIVNDTFKRIVNTHDVKGREGDKYTNGEAWALVLARALHAATSAAAALPPSRYRRDKDNTTSSDRCVWVLAAYDMVTLRCHFSFTYRKPRSDTRLQRTRYDQPKGSSESAQKAGQS